MYVSFEIRQFRNEPCFTQNGLMAASLDYSSLMRMYSTERTTAETAALTDYAEFNLFDCGYATEFFIGRVICSTVRKVINSVHLFFT